MEKRVSMAGDHARLAGAMARRNHEPISANPFPKRTEERRRWVAGWKAETDTCGAYYSRALELGGSDEEPRAG